VDSKALLFGVGIGVAATLLFEERGRRRRGPGRDTESVIVSGRRQREQVSPDTAAVPRGHWIDVVDDERLAERVRAALSLVYGKSTAIAVEATDGEVTLRGRIAAADAASVVEVTAAVHGVDAVINQLDIR
jgi:osmotically-inducible protein OsmY